MYEYYLFYSDGQIKPFSGPWLPDTILDFPKDTLALSVTTGDWFQISGDKFGSWWCKADKVPAEYRTKALLLT